MNFRNSDVDVLPLAMSDVIIPLLAIPHMNSRIDLLVCHHHGATMA
jgi:hypothetical protein